MPTTDPTGTTKLRAAFRADANRLVASFLTHVRQAVVQQDLLGVSGLLIPHTAMYGMRDPGGLSVKLQVFTNYINQLGYAVLVRQGEWLRPHLERAFTSGLRAGERWTKTLIEEPPAELDFLHAKSELEGIVDAIVQQTTRAVSVGLRRGSPPRKLYSDIMQVVRKIQALRLNLLGHDIVIHEHNLGRLYQFREAGHRKVGIIPEQRLTHDVRDDVNIQLGSNPCPICQDIAAEGPYDIDTAESLIPAHGNCQCAFIPADDIEEESTFGSASRNLRELLLGEAPEEVE